MTPLVRARLTGSLFSQARAANQTLFSGDRAGSRYYSVLENTTFGRAFIPSATSGALSFACGVGQNEAMSS